MTDVEGVADWMTVNEAAKRTAHTRQWVHHRIADGTFTAERTGRRVHVRTTSVSTWMLLEMQRLLERMEHLNLYLPFGEHSDGR